MTRPAAAALVFLLPVTIVRPAAAPRPTRIVSVVPAVTEALFALGAGDRVVGVSSFDHYPPEVASRRRVGALLDPDLEAIFALRPDLVVTFPTQQELQARLARAGVETLSVPQETLQEVYRSFEVIGARVGDEAAGIRLAAAMRRALDGVARAASAERPPKTLFVFGREPGSLRNIYCSGGLGFIHDLIGIAGGVNAFGDVPRQAVQASVEQIVARAPEVIVEVRAGAELTPAQRTAERAVWSALPTVPAVRSGRVHLLVDDTLVVPGPRLSVGARALARLLHPNLKFD